MNRLISKLIEDYIAFNPAVLVNKNTPKRKLSLDIIDKSLEEYYKLVDNTIILWSDLSLYALGDIKNHKPDIGYPIGINLTGYKYVSLKYISTKNLETGSKRINTKKYYECLPFANIDHSEDTIKYYKGLNKDIKDLRVSILNDKSYLYYKNVDKEIYDRFNQRVNGKLLTLNILNNLKKEGDYCAAECTLKFNPGDTNPGDWYIPEIGELIYIYAYKDIINYICSILIKLGFNDIYNKISNGYYWTSTFISYGFIYDVNINSDYIDESTPNISRIILPMLEL